jgi:hypothetical protein
MLNRVTNMEGATLMTFECLGRDRNATSRTTKGIEARHGPV